jgi:hypothetical protein
VELPLVAVVRWARSLLWRLSGWPTQGQLLPQYIQNRPLLQNPGRRRYPAQRTATGRSDQCQHLGEKPLPEAYSTAAARLRDLQRALASVQAERDCVSANVLAKQARSVLQRQGFQGWHRDHAAPRPGQGLAVRLPAPRRHGRDMRHIRDGQSPPPSPATTTASLISP